MTEYDATDTRPETYRRRLLELADYITDNVDDSHWDYSWWGWGQPYGEPVFCGTSACALGHATCIPEVLNAGIGYGLDGIFPEENFARAETFYGLGDSWEFNYLFCGSETASAGRAAGQVGLPITNKSDSRLTVAHAIRSFADWKYPAPKTKRVEKEGSKRWCAAKLREAAKWIETHGWIQGNYFLWVNGSYCGCAHGGIAAVSNLVCQRALACAALGSASVAAEEAGGAAHGEPAATTAERASSAAAAGATTSAAANAVAAANCPSYITEKHAWLVHFYAHMYGATFAFNDASGRTKEEVCRQLRAAAYAVEHGGKMPRWAPTEKAKAKVAA